MNRHQKRKQLIKKLYKCYNINVEDSVLDKITTTDNADKLYNLLKNIFTIHVKYIPWMHHISGLSEEDILEIDSVHDVIFKYFKEEIVDPINNGKTLHIFFEHNGWKDNYIFTDNPDEFQKMMYSYIQEGENPQIYNNVMMLIAIYLYWKENNNNVGLKFIPTPEETIYNRHVRSSNFYNEFITLVDKYNMKSEVENEIGIKLEDPDRRLMEWITREIEVRDIKFSNEDFYNELKTLKQRSPLYETREFESIETIFNYINNRNLTKHDNRFYILFGTNHKFEAWNTESKIYRHFGQFVQFERVQKIIDMFKEDNRIGYHFLQGGLRVNPYAHIRHSVRKSLLEII